jgi:hypothetical protein
MNLNLNLKSLLKISFCTGTLFLSFLGEGFAQNNPTNNGVAFECKSKDGLNATLRVFEKDELSHLEIYKTVIPFSPSDDTAYKNIQVFKESYKNRPQFHVFGDALAKKPFYATYYGTASDYDITNFYCTPSVK